MVAVEVVGVPRRPLSAVAEMWAAAALMKDQRREQLLQAAHFNTSWHSISLEKGEV
jgi:hypothetical protein